jgi:thioredoxin-related protein
MRILVPAVLVLASVLLVGAGSSFSRSAWLQGADGLIEALESVVQKEQALAVYFYTDWCGYCRQFERELLGNPEVKAFLGDGLAVMINPEKGDKEQQISRYYGVTGFPAFFVRNRSSNTLTRVNRMKMVNGRPQLLSPTEFIAACRDAEAR